MSEQSCRFDFTDNNQTVVGCSLHPKERRVLTPQTRNEVLTQLVKEGKWAGPALAPPAAIAEPPPASPSLPAFPELSGLFAQPELPEDFDPATAADYELTTHNTNADKRRLFALGRDVPPPVGPWGYTQLHALAGALYDGKGISELTGAEMAGFLARVELAAGGGPQTLSELQGLLDEQAACKETIPPLHATTGEQRSGPTACKETIPPLHATTPEPDVKEL